MEASSSSSAAGTMFPIAPQLQEVYGVSVMEAVQKEKLVKLVDIFQADQAKINMGGIRVFGLVISATMPRACSSKASHKYSCSFFIIDPFHHDPSKSICVNLFFNDLSKYNPIARIGDIIFCEQLKLQRYQDFPQLVGSFEKGCICIFHLKHDYKLGLCDRSSWAAIPGKGNKPTHILNPEQWSLHVYTNGPSEIAKVPSMLAKSIFQLTNWAESFFQQQSLADDKFIHASLQSLFTSYHTFKGRLEEYNSVIPHSKMPLQTTIGSPGQDILKVDFVGLVLHRIDNADPNAPLQLVLWDGTTHGMTNLAPFGEDSMSQVHASLSSVLQYLPATPNQAALVERWSTMHASLPPNHIIGQSLTLVAADPSLNVYLQRYTAGSWVRIRNLSVHHSLQPNRPVGQIRQDTHIGSLDPHYQDVTLLFQHYADRLEAFVPPPPPQQATASNANAGQETQTRPTSSRGSNLNAAGHPYTYLCEIACLPAPIRCCCRGKIVDWFPKQTKDFVQTAAVGSRSKESTFCFALRINDNTHTLDVLLHGDEAEKFLQVSARQFARNIDLQQALEARLEQTRETQTPLDLYIKIYTIKQGSKRTLGTTWKGSIVHSGLAKRFSVFDSQAPFVLQKDS